MAYVFFYKVRFKFRALGLCERELFAAAVQMWKVKGNEENIIVSLYSWIGAGA